MNGIVNLENMDREKLDGQIKNNLSHNKPNFTRRSGVNDTMMMVHSFAHLFIRQLAFECGYDASSLKKDYL